MEWRALRVARDSDDTFARLRASPARDGTRAPEVECCNGAGHRTVAQVARLGLCERAARLAGGGDPAIVDGFLPNHLQNLTAGPIGVPGSVTVKIDGKSQADEMAGICGSFGKSPPKGLLCLWETLGIKLVHPANVIIGQIAISGVERKTLHGYAHSLGQLLLASMSVGEVGEGLSEGIPIIWISSFVVFD